MFDAYQPFLIGFFVIAAVAVGMAVATLVTLVQERCGVAQPVVALSAAHPAAAATRRAA